MTDSLYNDPELTKTRRISFADLSAEQVSNVAEILNELEHVEAVPGEDGASVVVTYCVAEHKLEELEQVLADQGYRLENNLLERIRLGLIHFTEEIQQDNLNMPLRAPTRDDRLHMIYANAHQQHEQNDQSAPVPPEEMRSYF